MEGLNSGEPVALFKNQTIRLAVLTLAVFKVVSTVAIAKTANKTTSSGEPSDAVAKLRDRREPRPPMGPSYGREGRLPPTQTRQST